MPIIGKVAYFFQIVLADTIFKRVETTESRVGRKRSIPSRDVG